MGTRAAAPGAWGRKRLLPSVSSGARSTSSSLSSTGGSWDGMTGSCGERTPPGRRRQGRSRSSETGGGKAPIRADTLAGRLAQW